MSRIGSYQMLPKTGEAAQQAMDMKRLFAIAEQRIRKLEEKVTIQKKQIRHFHVQAKHEAGLTAEREELKAEIADLKTDIRQLIRANRKQVENLEALRAENTKLKAGIKSPVARNRTTGAAL